MTGEPINACPACKGEPGKLFSVHCNTGPDSSDHFWTKELCRRCGGSGSIRDAHVERIERGKRLRAGRIRAGLTVKQAAEYLSIRPSDFSSFEWGD